jgi:hypothetical protein
MTDLQKLKDRALEATHSGRYRKAAELYEEIASREPDADWRRRAGEAARRAGMLGVALQHFSVAAARYATEGFRNKAIALARLILQLDPSNSGATDLLESLIDEHTPLPAV